MQTHNHNTFTTIHTEGALLPVDLLQRIRANDASLEGLTPESYHLAPGEKLNEAINRSWNRLNGLWGAFQTARGRLGTNDPLGGGGAGTTLTRERWLLPLFQELGFGRLSTSKAIEIEGKSYPISHRWQNIPVHLVGCGLELDKRTPGAAGASRTSPHSMLQEYLNRSEDSQWGLVSNGLSLRILRDNATLTRQAYVDFDLESMFNGEVYADFVLLWLVCHQSRFETSEKQTDCSLERWSKTAQEQGTRALDDLRSGVEGAIVSLGQGFLQQQLNGELRARLKQGDLSSQDYYRQLLRLVYRLIFLFAAEDRELLLLPPSGAAAEAKERYLNYYSTARLRALSERQRGSRHYDRYEALRLVMSLLGSDKGCAELALPALGGFLFDARSTADLNDAKLDNQALLSAVRSLAFITQGNVRRAVDYRNLGPEELGSVYESLLELHPLLNTDAGTFELTSAAGNERKTTGSYYTPSSLIQVLLDSALDPVIENRLKGKMDSGQQEEALLSLNICDPACGSGHFLIAAAHRIAGKLAQLRNGGDEPSPDENRLALREVIRHCIYGVDINPMAVELCKVNLWLESLEPGKPLSFLDAHIKCGNSLVGVGPKMSLDDLEVPDEAFNPVTGDHRATASLLKKRNKQEREGQESLFVTVLKTKEDLDRWLAERTRIVEAMPEDNAVEVQAKADAYQKVNESAEYRKQRQIADLWTAAFFWKIEEPKGTAYDVVAPTHGQLRRLREGNNLQTGLLDQVEKISQSEEFFHWPLEFSEVATKGGFDCVLGNPPWERVQLEEKQYFESIKPEMASASPTNRQLLLTKLSKEEPDLWFAWLKTLRSNESTVQFLKISSRFPLSTLGNLNTYPIFVELSNQIRSSIGSAGLIIPSGLATDDTTKLLFQHLIETGQLAKFYDFENRKGLFPSVDSRFRFSLITTIGIYRPTQTDVDFVFFASTVNDLKEQQRHFTLSLSDVNLLNPLSKTCPTFRTKIDSLIIRNIFRKIPILSCGTDLGGWEFESKQMLNITHDSKSYRDFESLNILLGNISNTADIIEGEGNRWVRLFEGKMATLYDHRHASVQYRSDVSYRTTTTEETTPLQYINPNYVISPQYWINEEKVLSLIPIDYKYKWFVAFKRIASSTNERTMIASIIPWAGLIDALPVVYLNHSSLLASIFLVNLNSMVFDYIARTKVGGLQISHFILKQLPMVLPNSYSAKDINYLVPNVFELSYTAWDLQEYADSLWKEAPQVLRDDFTHQWEENSIATNDGHRNALRPGWCNASNEGFPYPPFKWDDNRRAKLRAELDAYYARLYGLNRKQMRYILDPADLTQRELEDILDPWEEVANPLDTVGYDTRRTASDFPGETFRVLKEKEIRQYGEYRTRRLVLEAWDRLEANGELPEPAYEHTATPLPRRESITLPSEPVQPASSPKREELPVQPVPQPKAKAAPEGQPTLSDFGLYKCEVCGKLVMGYDKEEHEQEVHGGKSVEWKKIR